MRLNTQTVQKKVVSQFKTVGMMKHPHRFNKQVGVLIDDRKLLYDKRSHVGIFNLRVLSNWCTDSYVASTRGVILV